MSLYEYVMGRPTIALDLDGLKLVFSSPHSGIGEEKEKSPGEYANPDWYERMKRHVRKALRCGIENIEKEVNRLRQNGDDEAANRMLQKANILRNALSEDGAPVNLTLYKSSDTIDFDKNAAVGGQGELDMRDIEQFGFCYTQGTMTGYGILAHAVAERWLVDYDPNKNPIALGAGFRDAHARALEIEGNASGYSNRSSAVKRKTVDGKRKACLQYDVVDDAGKQVRRHTSWDQEGKGKPISNVATVTDAGGDKSPCSVCPRPRKQTSDDYYIDSAGNVRYKSGPKQGQVVPSGDL
jgi:hypothetical protein